VPPPDEVPTLLERPADGTVLVATAPRLKIGVDQCDAVLLPRDQEL
jgi:hypothetical protein